MDKKPIISTIVLAFALFNNSLVLAGYSPLPFDSAKVEIAATSVFTIVSALWAWYEDNVLKKKVKKARQKKASMK